MHLENFLAVKADKLGDVFVFSITLSVKAAINISMSSTVGSTSVLAYDMVREKAQQILCFNSAEEKQSTLPTLYSIH